MKNTTFELRKQMRALRDRKQWHKLVPVVDRLLSATPADVELQYLKQLALVKAGEAEQEAEELSRQASETPIMRILTQPCPTQLGPRSSLRGACACLRDPSWALRILMFVLALAGGP